MNKQKVLVASKNPVKIHSTKLAFQSMFGGQEFDVKGSESISGVLDQPMSSDEALRGAMNRVEFVFNKYKGYDYYVGIEGGVERFGDEMQCLAHIVVKSRGILSKSQTAVFYLPKRVVELIDQGKELGEADDIVFGRDNSKQMNGSVGLLTDDVLDRTKYYRHALILALIPFKKPELYS